MQADDYLPLPGESMVQVVAEEGVEEERESVVRAS